MKAISAVVSFGAVLAAVFTAPPVVASETAASKFACVAPPDLVRLDHPLRRTGQRIAAGRPLTIVAIGSSSTSGAGASSPAMNYPSRLAVELKTLLPRAEINVINRGVGGETARDMLARFDEQVIAEKPDVVIWQVGSNSVLRDHPTPGEIIRQGVEKLKSSGAEVILINPQYAPKIISKPGVGQSVDVITATAHDAEVGLFDRFSVMRHWVDTEHMAFEQFLSPDLLHMNDWSYACVAKLLASAIVDGAKPPARPQSSRPARSSAERRFQTFFSAASRSSRTSS
jgi:lysophospholipase L1-like esterase